MTAATVAAATAANKESPGRILIVDDEEPIRIALGRTLRRLGFETADAPNGETGLAAIDSTDPEVVFLDLRMPGMDGHTFLGKLQASGNPHPPSVIVMSGHGNMNDVIDVMRQGAIDYLRKPWNLTELMSAVTRAVELRRKPVAALVDVTQAAPAGPIEDAARAARLSDLPGKLRRGEIVLPAIPAVLTSLRALIADQSSSIESIAACIERDPRVAADILRMANCAALARLGRVTNIKAAVTRLGLKHIHNLVQTIFLQGFCDVREGPYRKLLRVVWRRSVARAVSMRALCDVLDPTHALNGDTAYLIGLMADVGASLLLWVVSERAPGNLTADDVQDVDMVLKVVRRSHELLANVLLESWNLDKIVSATVAVHHRDTPPVTDASWWSLVVLGDALASRLCGEDDATAARPRDPVVAERCAADLCLPAVVLERLLIHLKEEFESIQSAMV